MNQDQLKALLLKVEECHEEFTLIFSGNKSRKVDGLYHPDTAEIIIHNKNMVREDELIYTGLHEYAHHLHRQNGVRPGRAHTREYWAIFHRLLKRAEEKGLYRNPLRSDPELKHLAERLRREFLAGEGERMFAFGRLLTRAFEICRDRGYSFEDFVDRELGLHRRVAKTLMESARADLPADVGYENIKSLLRIKDPQQRSAAARELCQGSSPDMVYQNFSRPRIDGEEDELARLMKEKRRIERSLHRLAERLKEIDARLLKNDRTSDSV